MYPVSPCLSPPLPWPSPDVRSSFISTWRHPPAQQTPVIDSCLIGSHFEDLLYYQTVRLGRTEETFVCVVRTVTFLSLTAALTVPLLPICLYPNGKHLIVTHIVPISSAFILDPPWSVLSADGECGDGPSLSVADTA